MSDETQKKFHQLQASIRDWEAALYKLRTTAKHHSPIAVATLNQDECKALIIGIRDAYDRLENTQ